jgi:MFS family permease
MQKYRTLLVLGIAQCFGQTAAPIMVLLGGLVGARLAPTIEWATLPIACMVIGTACTTVPASLLMSRFGRRAGFLIATGYGAAAGLIAAWSVNFGNFVVFCFSAFLVGSYGAFTQQFRFAVAESVPNEAVAKSLSLLMLAGIVAAFLGPEVAQRFSKIFDFPLYVGSYLGLSGLITCSFVVLLLFYRNVQVTGVSEHKAMRPFSSILRDSSLLLAIAAAVVGWSVMSLTMTATPVSMHEIDHLSLEDTTWVIQSHILAMYVPSLFSGFLITWLGVVRVIQAGLLLMIGMLIVGFGKPELIHYWGAMVLLGIGWNFLFVGGTTLLTQTYRTSERFKVQALNDFLVFGLQAIGSLGAGVLLATFGWSAVIVACMPWLLLLVPFLWFGRKSVLRNT